MPVNRVVAILTPLVFAPLAGAAAAWLAKNVPAVDVSPADLQEVFIAGSLIALAPAAQWLHGWQKYEARQAEAEQALELATPGPRRTRMRTTTRWSPAGSRSTRSSTRSTARHWSRVGSDVGPGTRPRSGAAARDGEEDARRDRRPLVERLHRRTGVGRQRVEPRAAARIRAPRHRPLHVDLRRPAEVRAAHAQAGCGRRPPRARDRPQVRLHRQLPALPGRRAVHLRERAGEDRRVRARVVRHRTRRGGAPRRLRESGAAQGDVRGRRSRRVRLGRELGQSRPGEARPARDPEPPGEVVGQARTAGLAVRRRVRRQALPRARARRGHQRRRPRLPREAARRPAGPRRGRPSPGPAPGRRGFAGQEAHPAPLAPALARDPTARTSTVRVCASTARRSWR